MAYIKNTYAYLAYRISFETHQFLTSANFITKQNAQMSSIVSKKLLQIKPSVVFFFQLISISILFKKQTHGTFYFSSHLSYTYFLNHTLITKRTLNKNSHKRKAINSLSFVLQNGIDRVVDFFLLPQLKKM